MEDSSKRLAIVLRQYQFEELALRAEMDEFHPGKSDHDLPEIMLYMELLAIVKTDGCPRQRREAARSIRSRHMLGEFDDKDCGSWSKTYRPGPFAQNKRMAMDTH